MIRPWLYRVGYLIGRGIRWVLLTIAEADRVAWDRHVKAALQVTRPETHDEWVQRMRALSEQDALEGSMRRHPAGRGRSDSWSQRSGGCER